MATPFYSADEKTSWLGWQLDPSAPRALDEGEVKNHGGERGDENRSQWHEIPANRVFGDTHT